MSGKSGRGFQGDFEERIESGEVPLNETELIEFSELWWNDVQEGEPIAQDEIDLVKELIAALKSKKEDAPTQWAYEQACKAIEKHRERADMAEKQVLELQDMTVHRIDIENGAINFALSGEPGQIFASVLLRFFEDNGGKNFFTFGVKREDMDLSVTVQNMNGEITPGEKLTELVKQLADLQKNYDGLDDHAEKLLQRNNKMKFELDAGMKLTKSEIDEMVTRIMQYDSFADTEECNFPIPEPTEENQIEFLDSFMNLMEDHVRGILEDKLLREDDPDEENVEMDREPIREEE